MKYTNDIVARLIELFETGNYKTSKDLAHKLSIPDYAVRRLLNKRGYKFGHFIPFKSKEILHVNEKMEEFIVGSLLGDGCITKYDLTNNNSRKNHNSKLTYCHSIVQRDYVEYKKQLMKSYNCSVNTSLYTNKKDSYINKRKIKSKPQITLNSTQNIYFNKYRDLWYNKGYKTIPMSIKITPFSLSIWFMDDGYKTKSSYMLCTDSFSLDEVKFLQKLLLKLKLETTIQHRSNKYYRLYIRKRSTKLFTNLIRPFICNSMKYKLHP